LGVGGPNPDSEFRARRIAVIGLAATGLATARILSERGAIVTVYDGKPEDKLDPARVAEAKAIPSVRLALGVGEPDWTETDLVVPSPGVPKWAPPIAGAFERGIPVWSEIEVAYRLAKAPILAITGTNGKTTTTALVGAICREAGLNTWVAGNIAEDEGKRTPLIVAAVECPADGVIVAEISSFQLEHVHTFRPKVAAWLNLSVDHMDRYASMEEYAEAKAKIFAAQTEDDFAVLNRDDDMVMRFSKNIGAGRRSTFTANDGVGICTTGTTSYYFQAGKLWVENRLIGGGLGALVGDLPLKGLHNIANFMVAVRMTTAIGIELETIASAMKSFRGVAHRMEFVADVAGVRYINNSMCTNPAAVEASVSAIDTPLVAIAGGIHKGGDLTPMYDSLKRGARKVVLIGAAKQEIADGLHSAGMDAEDISFAETLPEAVNVAASLATEGDTVMLVPGCASFDMFSGFEERGAIFREAVRELPGALTPPPPSPSEGRGG
jgi:UDP-N-acetylmuramoylalanine--D-glutamate ligase